MPQPATVLFHELPGQARRILGARLEDDDVAVRDDVARQRREVDRRVGQERVAAERRGCLAAGGCGEGDCSDEYGQSNTAIGPANAGSAQTDPLGYVRQPDRHGARAPMRAGCSLEALRPRLSTGLPLSRSPTRGCDCAVASLLRGKLGASRHRISVTWIMPMQASRS